MLPNDASLRGADTVQSANASFSRQATRRLRPLLRPTDSKWRKDADIDHGHLGQQDSSRWKVLILAFQTLGVVYGDIGTSPLYVFAGVFNGYVPVTTDNILGACSLIIWTITAITVVKYALIVLRADDNGQGGSFALYAQLRRQGMPDPDAASSKDPNASGRSSHLVGTTPARVMGWRQRFIEAKPTQIVLMLAVVFGVGLIMGDGVLTPAISVVSAIEGLQTGIPSITQGVVTGVSVAILAVLFLIQQFGTATIGYSFAPVVALWFAANSVIGIYNIAKYSPGIFKVLGPNYWFSYFLRNHAGAWRSLSGVLLSITGAEALFADLGHFNRQSIQLGMLCVVYPALLLTYLGQAAYLTKHPDNVANTYFSSMPNRGVFWAMLIVATGAAIVASQALISASYQIVSQAIRLSFFPRFKITHTSEKHTGQIYIAIINYVLMALTIIVVIAFKNSTRLGLAYGLAVNMDLLLTTCFLSLVILTVWRKQWVLPLLFFIVFAAIEATFLSSAILKVPKGGWFSLMMAGIYGYVMLLWFWGSNAKRKIFDETRKHLSEFVKVKRTTHSDGSADDNVTLMSNPRQLLHRLPGVGLFYDGAISGVPHPLVALVDTFPTLPRIVVFMTIRFVPVPEVLPLERYLVEQLGAPGFYHVIARYGYTQRVHQSEEEVTQINKHILALLYRTLRFKMQHDDSLRGVLQAHPLSAAAQTLVEGALGDMHGSFTESTYPENVNTLSQNSISIGGMSLSIHGLSTRRNRTASRLAGERPSIMNVAWGGDGGDVELGLPTEDGADHSVPEDSTAHGPPLESLEASLYSTLTTSKTQRARRSAVLAFERELMHFSDQVAAALAARKKQEASPEGAARLDVLRTLAREIGLVAVAAQDGCLCHVVGRAHIPLSRAKNPFRKYVMELPFAFLLRNTEQDIATTFQIDEAKLVEVGLRYYL